MTQSTLAAAVVASTAFTLPIHFKRWSIGSKGHADLQALAAKGVIADFAKEVEESKDEDGTIVFKRKSLTYAINTLDCTALLADSGLSLAHIDHIQELINAAIKKDVQTMVADPERTSPVTEADLPTWDTVLSQPFNKRPTAIKVTTEMVNAAVEALAKYLEESGVKEGGINLTKSLCVKKFSLSALNAIETPVVEKVQGLLLGWFESLTEGEQLQHAAVVSLFDANIDAKLNPKQEDISVDMF